MLFNSFEFLIFLPVVFLLYWNLCRSRMQQNLLIVIASYFFYGWWDWRFLLLIAFTSLCSYVSGIAIGRCEGQRSTQKYISAANIILNLSILGVFKYYDFFAESFAELLRGLGYHMDAVTLNVILPVGISFYTFQALSYSIDVYQGKIRPTKDIVQFFAYISFFPQLVAGPIERATNLLPQFDKQRRFEYAQTVDGIRQMLWGFFKKLVVADNCAFIVNQYWDDYSQLPGTSIFFLGILFSFQIYCDFSGYSDIAIGCAKLFGVRLMQNFDAPYFSRNIGEFWRRWHISLMSWFRDYVYIPLGGSRCSKWRTMSNILIVFLISGLWHGANWTFVIWGGYNGILIILSNLVGWNTKYKTVVANEKLLPTATEFAAILTTFILVVIGWIIFRAENFEQLNQITTAMLSNQFLDFTRLYGKMYLLLPLLIFFIEWLQRGKEHALQLPDNCIFRNRALRWGLYIALYLCIVSFTGQSQEFIYFQF